MTGKILSFLLLAGSATGAQGQTYGAFPTSVNLDVNHLKAAHLVHGDMWWDPATSLPVCEYPRGSAKHVGYAAALWMGGYDPQNNLHVSAQTYRQNGNDYWPGPLDTSSQPAYRYATAQQWARIWKIDRTDLQTFLAATTHTVSNTPAPILEWPAKGNPYAKGAGGNSLTITSDMAPFVDVNNDGQYNPLSGDYPVMKGDQMLWWIINDDGPSHTETAPGRSLQLEIRNTAYAYSRGTLADDILFYEFQLTNRASVPYTGFRVGLAADLDLGDPTDDYTGFDSTHRMGFIYNATGMDGNGGVGTYGSNIPMAGVTLTELPGDAGNNYVPAGSFTTYTNTNLPSGNPSLPEHYNNLLRSLQTQGQPLPGNPRYFSGDSTDCHNIQPTFDRRMVIASDDMTLAPGATKKVGMALVVTPKAGGCPNVTLTGIHNVADTAWHLYHHPPAPLGVPALAARKALQLFPNPAQNTLTLSPGDDARGSITVYDATGRILPVSVIHTGSQLQLDIRPLATGVYTAVYRAGEVLQYGMFAKQ